MMTKKMLFAIVLALLSTAKIYSQDVQTDFIWYDNTLPMEDRIEALVDAMTLEEKILQMMDEAPAIDRLGVPRYGWWNEALHGVARTGRATVFPQAIGLAATFDNELIYRVGTAISDEARAKFNVAIANGNRSRYAGLTFWSPNVNLFRDPRWGRGQETYGEDPFLSSHIGTAFVRGIQGNDPNYLKAAACAKHYVVHSGPEALRHEFDAVVSKKDLWETYMPAFRALVVDAKVEGVMGAYNRTNGESASGSHYLLTEVLRDKWGFDGYVVSDCGSIRDIWEGHQLVETPEEAAAVAIKSGLNLNCGHTFHSLGKSIDQGLITEADLDQSLKQLLKTRFRLGFFDPDDQVPFGEIGPEVVGSDKHVALAREAAQKSVVLVKNKNNVLPLKKDIKTLYVCGPQAANADVLLGNYYGVSQNTVNILDGIASKVSIGTSINYKFASLPYRNNVNPVDWVTGEAAFSDATIAVFGIDGRWEGEEGESIASATKGDNTDSKLPQSQIDFIKKLRSKGDKPLIVVISGGSPIIIPEVYEIADAVIYCFYPGEQGGNGLADVIFGDAAPSGRLPFTVPFSVDDLPPYEDYAMEGRTYRYMSKDPLFPFGFGLSYTSFEYSNVRAEAIDNHIVLSATIANTGDMDAEEVAQIYISSPKAGEGHPLYALKAIHRLELAAGESKEVKFGLNADSFKVVNEEGELMLLKGDHTIYIGGSVPSGRSDDLGATQAVSTTISYKSIKKTTK